VKRTYADANQELSVPSADKNILKPAKSLGKYIEYDFSKMTDTKGGFLDVTDDPNNRALNGYAAKGDDANKPPGMTMEEWERMQLLKKLRASKQAVNEPILSVLAEKKEGRICRECESLDVDFQWVDVFGIAVCRKCKKEFADKYSLLTKTEAREDYLLTNPELQDEEILPHLKRPNPHKSTWNDMQLYLRFQVEEYAFSDKKWGSSEALDEEFEKRQLEKTAKKEKKFKEKLLDLKKKTRTEAYRRNQKLGDDTEARFGMAIASDRHVHEWGRPTLDPETGTEVKLCVECGMECEELELG
jgi:DNA-repair protein complementing XP-A cells